MSEDDGFGRMVDAAIAAHELLLAHGTSTMQLLSRLLLIEVGAEIALRRDAETAANDNPDDPDG
ncbi:hypothetical protein [Methylobacterium sp. E-066]|uniref:hypothetical protein n=2 Tax=unclassified Methylobacterium TaxID=2615210 RepID=UPI001FBB729B|nr:hypothetical protein [Methylobacterium sp. E-066]MCJ2140918.1 hypothetical protein [Methylobacterium sp. E-066]